MTRNSPELVWVTVTGSNECDVFSGRVLNHPQQLETVSQGTEIKFVAAGGEHLLMVTEKYLAEREKWNIHGCNKCGCNELFDAPSDLMRVIFPDIAADASIGMFTSFCGICGGVQVIQDKSKQSTKDGGLSKADPRKWWQFWR